MIVTAYAAYGKSTHVAEAWSRGGGGPVVYDMRRRPGPALMYAKPVLHPLWREVQAAGEIWFYGDNGYLGPPARDSDGRGGAYAITRNALQHDGAGPGDMAKLARLGIRCAPWRRDGRHVLVLPPGDRFAELHRFSAAVWLTVTLAAIAEATDRPIVVRRKADAAERPLACDLADAWAVVTHSSKGGIEAAIAGIPVFCTAPCAAASLGSLDLAAIERPARPEREPVLAALAANQWTLDEIASGACRAWLEAHP